MQRALTTLVIEACSQRDIKALAYDILTEYMRDSNRSKCWAADKPMLNAFVDLFYVHGHELGRALEALQEAEKGLPKQPGVRSARRVSGRSRHPKPTGMQAAFGHVVSATVSM